MSHFLSLLHFIQIIRVGIDISEDALAVARSNADLLGFSTADVTFKVGSFDDLHSSKLDLCDWNVQTVEITAIVCNPPYSSKKEVSSIQFDWCINLDCKKME